MWDSCSGGRWLCSEAAKTVLGWHLGLAQPCPWVRGHVSSLPLTPPLLTDPRHTTPASQHLLQKCPFTLSPSSPTPEIPLSLQEHLTAIIIIFVFQEKGICVNSNLINTAHAVFLHFNGAGEPRVRPSHYLVRGGDCFYSSPAPR